MLAFANNPQEEFNYHAESGQSIYLQRVYRIPIASRERMRVHACVRGTPATSVFPLPPMYTRTHAYIHVMHAHSIVEHRGARRDRNYRLEVEGSRGEKEEEEG